MADPNAPRAAQPQPPLITFSRAQDIGGLLHARWKLMTGEEAPLSYDDMAWGDIVQFVIRKAREDAGRG